jgi:hypothetical protein
MTGSAEALQALAMTTELARRYVVMTAEQADAVALWVGHSYLYDQFDTTPYLAVQSATRRSGKTRLLEVLRLAVREPLPTAGTSVAALFRIVHELHPTLLLDEADAIFHHRKGDTSAEDLRGLLNAGYRAGTAYLRVVGEGKKMRVERFDVFCPKVVASIGRLPDTVQDRSIVLTLKRRARSETVERFRFRTAELEAVPVREWWEAAAQQLQLPESATVPDTLDDRAADSWEPLLALADAAGGDWPARARKAALTLSGGIEVDDDTLGIRLLDGIRRAFTAAGTDRLATTTLIDMLRADEEAPWAEYGPTGRPLRAEGLAYLLRPYGVRSRQMKIAGVNVHGFELAQFGDPFDRYLPLPVDTRSARYPATPEHDSERESSGVAGETPLPGEVAANGGEPLNGSAVDLWDLHHDCHRCRRPAPDSALTIVGGFFYHRDACPNPVTAA